MREQTRELRTHPAREIVGSRGRRCRAAVAAPRSRVRTRRLRHNHPGRHAPPSATRAANSSSKRVFPMPTSPRTSTSDPAAATPPSASPSAESADSRPMRFGVRSRRLTTPHCGGENGERARTASRGADARAPAGADPPSARSHAPSANCQDDQWLRGVRRHMMQAVANAAVAPSGRFVPLGPPDARMMHPGNDGSVVGWECCRLPADYR